MSNRAERRRAEKRAREEVKRQIAKATRERACGDCTACCTAQGVKELGKPAGVACTYLTPNQTSCSRYATRPESCRSWSCLWRVGLFNETTDRPDKRGLVFDVTGKLPAVWPGPTHQALIAREAWPGAFEENQAWLDELSSTSVVVLVFPKGRRVLGPPDVVAEVEKKMRRMLPVLEGRS